MSRILFVFLIFHVLRIEGQFEGDSCTNNDLSGVCKDITRCPSALEDLKRRIAPKICAFSGSNPIVCCIEAAPALTSTTTTTTTTTPAPVTVATPTTQRPPVATTKPSSTVSTTTEYTPEYATYEEVEEAPRCAPLDADQTAPRNGQKAWDKCIEYQEQLVFPCAPSVALAGGGAYVRSSNCRHNANELVINGIDAKEGEFPHMALLGFGEEKQVKFQCGGSIISESFILTAGHCTYSIDLGAVTFALVGTLRRSADYPRGNLYGVRSIHRHPRYAPPKRYNDIALLETDRRIKLSSFVVPACLDTGAQMANAALATGWGALANGSNADVLQKVRLMPFDELECILAIPPSRVLREGIDPTTQTCFGDKRESKDTCQGDSGGPLQINSKRIKCMYVVVGVTSFGRQCGIVGVPGVYTRVAPYLDWIESVVWP